MAPRRCDLGGFEEFQPIIVKAEEGLLHVQNQHGLFRSTAKLNCRLDYRVKGRRRNVVTWAQLKALNTSEPSRATGALVLHSSAMAFRPSQWWQGYAVALCKSAIIITLGDGRRAKFWTDNWLPGGMSVRAGYGANPFYFHQGLRYLCGCRSPGQQMDPRHQGRPL